MTNEQYKILISKIDNIDEEINRVDRDLANDRRDIDKFNVTLETVAKLQEQILDRLSRSEIKTKDAVRDAVESAVEPVQDTLNTFVKKPTLTREVRIISLKDFLFGLAKKIYDPKK